MATVYQYNADGYFAGEVDDYGLLPNNATRTAPQARDGHVARWTGNAWALVADHKGKEGYVDGQPFTVTAYGPLPEGWSDAAPLPSLDDVKTAKLAEINAAFAASEANGWIASSLGFDVDATERANRDTEGLITMMSATGAGETYFCDRDNVMRIVTLEQMRTIRLEIIGHGQAMYARKWALREAVNAAENLEAVAGICWPGTNAAAGDV